MTDRIEPGGGGMTGATGDLTPDDDTSFVPGERRQIEEPEWVARESDVPQPAASGEVADDRASRPPRIGGDEVLEGDDRF